MEGKIFKIFTDNKIYFCSEINCINTTNLITMKECFDIFVFKKGWLFYRLKNYCEKIGYIDNEECLIRPSDNDYDRMVCLIRLFVKNEPIDFIESTNWIEEKDFNQHKINETLYKLIKEINSNNVSDNVSVSDNNISDSDDISESDDISNETSDELNSLSNSLIISSENKGVNTELMTDKHVTSKNKNFQHGYSSSED